jgi:hypothetical protein
MVAQPPTLLRSNKFFHSTCVVFVICHWFLQLLLSSWTHAIMGVADADTTALAEHTLTMRSLHLHSISNTFNGLFGSAMLMDWVQFCLCKKGKQFGANLSFELGSIINCLSE